jgi:hypothetical protein
LLSRRCLQRPGIYCQFLVVVHVIDVLIGYWVSYPSNGLKRGKISMVGHIHESLHLSKKVHCTIVLFAKCSGFERHSCVDDK